MSETKRRAMEGLSTHEYEHPFDRKALTALEGTPGLPTLIKTINKYSFDKVNKIIYTGSYVQVGENQYPRVHGIFMECCRVLDVKTPPRLYLMPMYEVNALATCYSDPIVAVSTGAVETMSDDELHFLLGHELGHVKGQHMLYHDMARIIAQVGVYLGDITLGIGSVVSLGLQLAILYWYRMAEFSCDRAGMLACQNTQACLTAAAKMGGFVRRGDEPISIDAFLLQAREFIGFDYDTLDKLAKIYSVMENTHPWTVMRAHELDNWVMSGQYEAVLNRKPALPQPAQRTTCAHCGRPLASNDVFCSQCGQRRV